MPLSTRRSLSLTPFQAHCQKWRDGCGSEFCSQATHVCIARGTVPCDILFVGEAPGNSENAIGIPFIGPAGKLLDRIVQRSLTSHPTLTVAFTNVVGCLPREEHGDPARGKKAAEPTVEQMQACKPRLEEFIALARPRIIVSVGAYAKAVLLQGFKHSVKLPSPTPLLTDIKHPAAILREQVVRQGLSVQQCVVRIRTVIEDWLEADGKESVV